MERSHFDTPQKRKGKTTLSAERSFCFVEGVCQAISQEVFHVVNIFRVPLLVFAIPPRPTHLYRLTSPRQTSQENPNSAVISRLFHSYK